MAVCDTRNSILGTNNIGNDPNMAQSNIIREILGPRADSMTNKMEMNNAISLFGQASQNELSTPRVISSQSVNTLDVYLLGAGMKSDVVLDGTVMSQGLRIREQESKGKA